MRELLLTRQATRALPDAAWMRRYGPALAAYALATIATSASFMGDTGDYVSSIVALQTGGPYAPDNPFWEFGHLLWRPLGWVAWHAARPLTSLAVGPDDRLQVWISLTAMSWLAGLASVVLVRMLLARIGTPDWAASVVTMAFCFSAAFLNYTRTGSAYVPGLALLLLGTYILVASADEERSSARGAVAAGVSLGCAVCVWLPYAVVVPAALASPLLVRRPDGPRARLAAEAGLVCGFAVAAAYAVVALANGFTTAQTLIGWAASAAHGFHQGGIARAAFGLPRSFIDTGDDGVLFKRFLLRDPFNPVSLADLVTATAWKLVVFYLAAAAMLGALARSDQGRRVLALALLSGLPVLVFAVAIFEGGSPERYMPWYPFAFAALALGLSSHRAPWPLRATMAAFIVIMAWTNFSALARPSVERRQAAAEARITPLEDLLQPRSMVAVPLLQDDLWELSRDAPFSPIFRRGNLNLYPVLWVGSDRIRTWREDFAARAQMSWTGGGDVWVSARLFTQRPRPEWKWVEGDDPNVSWRDVNAFFTSLDVSDPVGGDDGFVLLRRTPANVQRLSGRELPAGPGATASAAR